MSIVQGVYFAGTLSKKETSVGARWHDRYFEVSEGVLGYKASTGEKKWYQLDHLQLRVEGDQDINAVESIITLRLHFPDKKERFYLKGENKGNYMSHWAKHLIQACCPTTNVQIMYDSLRCQNEITLKSETRACYGLAASLSGANLTVPIATCGQETAPVISDMVCLFNAKKMYLRVLGQYIQITDAEFAKVKLGKTTFFTYCVAEAGIQPTSDGMSASIAIPNIPCAQTIIVESPPKMDPAPFHSLITTLQQISSTAKPCTVVYDQELMKRPDDMLSSWKPRRVRILHPHGILIYGDDHKTVNLSGASIYMRPVIDAYSMYPILIRTCMGTILFAAKSSEERDRLIQCLIVETNASKTLHVM